MGIPRADRGRPRAVPVPPDVAADLAAHFPVAVSGLVRHLPGDRVARRPRWDGAERRGRLAAFVADIRQLAAAFDRRAAASGLGTRMCVEDLCAAAARDPRIVETYHADVEHGGRVHANQLETAVDVMAAAIARPRRSVLVLGALQSGKTGTALCLQFLGPVAYLLTGVRTYPFLLLPNQVSHETQARREFTRFLTFYGGARFVRGEQGCSLVEYMEGAGPWDALSERPLAPPGPRLDATFSGDPSLDTYRRAVVPQAGADAWAFMDPRDVVRRRMPVGGRAGRDLRDFVVRLVRNGIVPVPVVDETQYGASDRAVGGRRRSCVLKSVLDLVAEATRVAREDAVADALAKGGTGAGVRETLAGLHGPRGAVLLSATPYGLVSADDGGFTGRAGLTVVPQRLPPGYVGLNCFMGLPIDPAAPVTAPRVLDLAAVADGDPFLPLVDMSAYFRIREGGDGARAMRAWARRHRVGRDLYDPEAPAGPQAERYCASVEGSLRALLIRLSGRDGGMSPDGQPRGVCVRFGNANAPTFRLLMRLRLEDEVEVLRFCDKVPGGDVKGFLRHARREPDRPYVLAVTNRARMGDAFPRHVDTFVDLSRKASDLNALLQGLLGRACGIGKSSTVVMSAANAALVRAYLERDGGVASKASRHAVPLGPYRAPGDRAVATLRRGVHPAIDRFLDRFDAEVVSRVLGSGGARAQDRGAVDPQRGRFLPLYAIADEEGVLDLVERDPGLAVEGATGTVRLLRPGEELDEGLGPIRHFACPERPGWVHVGFRAGDRRNRASGRVRGIGTVAEPHAFVRGVPPRLHEVELPLARPVRTSPGRGTALTVGEWHAFDCGLGPVERMERAVALDAASAGWA